MVASNRRDDDTSQGILNFLKTIERDCGEIVVQGVAVVQL
jgi:hypothetical protein